VKEPGPVLGRIKSENREKSIDESINEYYTFSMKTAISIPDDLFEQVEMLSKKRRSSRSEVFATAVKDLLEKER
jgi:hypothetical protein